MIIIYARSDTAFVIQEFVKTLILSFKYVRYAANQINEKRIVKAIKKRLESVATMWTHIWSIAQNLTRNPGTVQPHLLK